jgi:hypothetical protein
MITCDSCGNEISPKAVSCPKCGHPNPKAKHLSGSQIFWYLLAAGVIFWWLSGNESGGYMTNISNQVASDEVKKYQIAKQGGDKMQICVQAGIVSAAYLQAKDQTNHRLWNTVKSAVCDEAGVPR